MPEVCHISFIVHVRCVVLMLRFITGIAREQVTQQMCFASFAPRIAQSGKSVYIKML
jgi:hypothetical protein